MGEELTTPVCHMLNNCSRYYRKNSEILIFCFLERRERKQNKIATSLLSCAYQIGVFNARQGVYSNYCGEDIFFGSISNQPHPKMINPAITIPLCLNDYISSVSQCSPMKNAK